MLIFSDHKLSACFLIDEISLTQYRLISIRIVMALIFILGTKFSVVVFLSLKGKDISVENLPVPGS